VYVCACALFVGACVRVLVNIHFLYSTRQYSASFASVDVVYGRRQPDL
jgi:hypothetical protein